MDIFMATSVGVKIPQTLGTMYSDYDLIPRRYEQQWHKTNNMNNNIQGLGCTILGELATQ